MAPQGAKRGRSPRISKARVGERGRIEQAEEGLFCIVSRDFGNRVRVSCR